MAVNGPWRILETCPSVRHNSEQATRAMPSRCVCPRAIQLMPVRWSRLPGHGPWRIEDTCPAEHGHNTLAAAQRARRCVCPRAIALRPKPSSLPGGGPWRIDEDCTAPQHNTETAGLGRTGRRGQKRKVCICPRAQALRPGGLLKMREYAKGVKVAHLAEVLPMQRVSLASPLLPVWWQGPWRIDERCPSAGHNTMQRAMQKIDPCICPRALTLLAEKEERKARRAARRANLSVRQRKFSTMRAAPVNHLKAPDLSAGPCRREMQVADEAQDTTLTHAGVAARAAARELCEKCPLLTARACRTWVLTQEKPAGAWPGVWGGLDQWQRTGEDVVVTAEGRIEVIDFEIGGSSDVTNPF
jgi:hypothetical protein